MSSADLARVSFSTFLAGTENVALKDPRGKRFGSLDGTVLIGTTDDGEVGVGEWIWADFKKGKCVEAVQLKDPSGIKGRFDLMLPGESDPERLMDVRAVARTGTVVAPDEELDALKSRRIVVAGDEAFFIRFTPELLSLLRTVLAP
jgi:hypothetical protein